MPSGRGGSRGVIANLNGVTGPEAFRSMSAEDLDAAERVTSREADRAGDRGDYRREEEFINLGADIRAERGRRRS